MADDGRHHQHPQGSSGYNPFPPAAFLPVQGQPYPGQPAQQQQQAYYPPIPTGYPQSLYSAAQVRPPQQQQPQQQQHQPHQQHGVSISPATQFSGPTTGSKRSRSPTEEPSPGQANGSAGGRKPQGKKKRLDLAAADGESASPSPDPKDKIKLTRGSRACTVCRRLKMKCEGAENGPPCKRCIQGVHECIFEESMRGKRNHKKQEALTGKLQSLEQKLNTLQASLPPSAHSNVDPGISPTPSSLIHATPSSSALTHSVPSVPASGSAGDPNAHAHAHSAPADAADTRGRPSQSSSAPDSPLPNLPNNALNPLGLLAEASLQGLKHRGSHRTRSESRRRDDPRGGSARPGADGAGPGGRAGERDGPGEPGSEDQLREYEDDLQAHAKGVGKGIAGESYFRPGPMTLLPIRRLVIERQIQPEILEFVEMDEVLALFEIFFDNLNNHCCLLDREFHNAPLVCSRSPFLLTAICAIASKFYKGRDDGGELHVRLNNVAKKLAWSTPAQGYKSVEIVQAYLLLALWGTGPVQRFEQDRTWLLLGMAIRMATDLNLHRASPTSIPLSGTYAGYDDELEEENGRKRRKRTGAEIREVRNRERTWIMCYNLDRSLSAQMGKPYSIQEDYILRNASLWAQHPDALLTDKALCGFLEYQRILSRCVEFFHAGTSDPSGLLKNCDWSTIIKAYEAQLGAWRDGFHKARDQENWTDPAPKYRLMVSALHHNYSLLVINTFGLHYAREHSHVDIAHFFSRCYSTAVECARIIIEELGPSGYLKYSPDSHFVLCSYAVITLLKLVRLEFESYLPAGVDPIKNVRDAADVLTKVAVNKYHTPALYAAFLRALINVRDGTSGPATRHTSVAPTTPAPPHNNAGSTTEVSEQLSPYAELNGEAHQSHGGSASEQQQQSHDALPPPPAGPEYNMVQQPMAYGEPMSAFNNSFQQHSQGAPDPTQGAGVHDFPDYTFGAGLGGGGMEVDELGNLSGPFGGILTDAFWDSVLIPGYSNTLDLSGGFVFGSGGSGLITPRLGSPNFGVGPMDFGLDQSLQGRT